MEGLRQPLTDTQRLLIEQRVGNEAPSIALAYILWALLGFVSLHRFYIGLPRTAVLQIVLNFLVIGLIWLLVDLFLIPGLVREKREAIRAAVTAEVVAGR
ncbi:MAG: TM2 domain-containing protein [Pseudomonadota bacterium]